MERPTILIAEEEPGAALSTRKLVLETAKFNVLTAHSTREAITVFQKFPNVSAVVVAESVVDTLRRNCQIHRRSDCEAALHRSFTASRL